MFVSLQGQIPRVIQQLPHFFVRFHCAFKNIYYLCIRINTNNMKNYLFKILILLCSLAIGGSAWADTVTFTPSDFTGQGTSGYGGAMSVTKNGVTFACNDGYGTTDIRCYNGSTITISSSSTITALSFSFADSNTGGLKASYTGLSTTSWSQRMFEQARLTEVTVTYTASGGGGTSHKATFYVNGELYNEAAVTEGASVIFPNNPSSVGGKSFIGWATTAIVGTTDDKPSMVTSANMGDTDRSFYAVYAKRTELNATFNAADLSNLTQDGENLRWTENTTGVVLFMEAGMLNTTDDIKKFVVTSGTSHYFEITAPIGYYLSSVVVNYTRQNTTYYSVGSVSSGASVSNDDATQKSTITFISEMNAVKAYATSNQLRAKLIEVTAYKNEAYCTTVTVPVTMGTAGYATFACTEALDLSTLPDELTAYRAVVDGKTVTFKPISQAVPANTGLLLKGANNGNYEITIANSGAEVEGGNAFLVNTAGTTFSGDNDYYYFGLKKDTFTFGTFDPATVAIPANKAYLKIAKSAFPAGARELSLVFEEESTGMDASLVNSEKRILNSEIYDLQGRRVVKPVKGLYIVNGKKVMVE